MSSKRKKQHYKRCNADKVVERLRDMYKDFADILNMPFYASEVASIIYDLTGNADWMRKWQEQFDIWVKGGMK